MASPWRTSTGPAAVTRLSASRIGRPGHTEKLGEPALAGQRSPRLHLAAEHVGDDLLEDVLGYRAPVDRLQGHGPRCPINGQRSSGSYQSLVTTSQVIAFGYLRRGTVKMSLERRTRCPSASPESSIPRWLRFVLRADRAGSSWYIGAGFFFAPVLAVLSPWPAVTAALWRVIAVAGLWHAAQALAASQSASLNIAAVHVSTSRTAGSQPDRSREALAGFVGRAGWAVVHEVMVTDSWRRFRRRSVWRLPRPALRWS